MDRVAELYKRTDLLVALSLLKCGWNETGRFEGELAELVAWSGLGRSTVKRAVARMVRRRHVERIAKAPGRGQVLRWLAPIALPDLAVVETPENSAADYAQDSPAARFPSPEPGRARRSREVGIWRDTGSAPDETAPVSAVAERPGVAETNGAENAEQARPVSYAEELIEAHALARHQLRGIVTPAIALPPPIVLAAAQKQALALALEFGASRTEVCRAQALAYVQHEDGRGWLRAHSWPLRSIGNDLEGAVELGARAILRDRTKRSRADEPEPSSSSCSSSCSGCVLCRGRRVGGAS